MVYRIVKALLVLALSGPLSLSALLSLYHLVQVTEARSGTCESPSKGILKGAETWISGSHAHQVQPVHLCGVCILAKNLRGAAPTASSPAAPLSSSTAIPALACGEKYRSPGFFCVSRSPPDQGLGRKPRHS